MAPTRPRQDLRMGNSLLEEREDGVSSLKTATPLQYAAFLHKHLKNGGVISHIYDYPFERAGIKIATQSVSIPKGCGTKAINVIVPDGMTINRVGDGNNDHGDSYNMKDGSVSGSWTPIYPDVVQIMIDRGWYPFKKSDFDSHADEEDVNNLTNGNAHFGDMPEAELTESKPPKPLKAISPRSKAWLTRSNAPAEELKLTKTEWEQRERFIRQLRAERDSDTIEADIETMDNKQLLVKLFNTRTKVPEKMLNLVPYETLKAQFNKTIDLRENGPILIVAGMGSVGSFIASAALSYGFSSYLPILIGTLISVAIPILAFEGAKSEEKKNAEIGQETLKMLKAVPSRRLLPEG